MESFQDARDELHAEASKSIAKVQRENLRTFNRRRKEPKSYREGDLVAIRRTQLGPGLKFGGKYLGPYEITRVMRNQRYLVQKVGEHEGPAQTSTSADYMKSWIEPDTDVSSEDEEH